MPLDLATVLMCVALGAVTGVVAALCGVGGGIIMVPAFVWLLKINGDQRAAIATSLVAIILTSVAASAKNVQNNYINWRIALITGLASALVAYFAADYLKKLQNDMLIRIFAIIVILMGLYQFWSSFRPAKAPSPATTAPQTAADTPTAGK